MTGKQQGAAQGQEIACPEGKAAGCPSHEPNTCKTEKTGTELTQSRGLSEHRPGQKRYKHHIGRREKRIGSRFSQVQAQCLQCKCSEQEQTADHTPGQALPRDGFPVRQDRDPCQSRGTGKPDQQNLECT